jgi:hypothetical protein
MMEDNSWYVQGKIFDGGNKYSTIKLVQQIYKKNIG